MKEIHISKRHIFVTTFLTLVIVTGILVIHNWPSHSGQGDPQMNIEDRLASSAAVSAVEKIFQLTTPQLIARSSPTGDVIYKGYPNLQYISIYYFNLSAGLPDNYIISNHLIMHKSPIS